MAKFQFQTGNIYGENEAALSQAEYARIEPIIRSNADAFQQAFNETVEPSAFPTAVSASDLVFLRGFQIAPGQAAVAEMDLDLIKPIEPRSDWWTSIQLREDWLSAYTAHHFEPIQLRTFNTILSNNPGMREALTNPAVRPFSTTVDAWMQNEGSID